MMRYTLDHCPNSRLGLQWTIRFLKAMSRQNNLMVTWGGVAVGDVDFRKSPMKMIYRKLSKTAALPVTCHSAHS
jgi:hypothetical protein